MLRVIAISVALLTAVSCGADSDPGAACVDPPSACTPLYEPTFDSIHSRTIVPGCAISGGTCHQMSGGPGGFSLLDIEAAHNLMKTQSVDAECGVLLKRIHTDDPAELMPPGKKLSDGELCAITQWVSSGAAR